MSAHVRVVWLFFPSIEVLVYHSAHLSGSHAADVADWRV